MFYSFHVTPFLCRTLFMLHHFLYCTFLVVHTLLLALFSCFILFVKILHFVLFSCCTFLRAALFPRCTFSILYFFHVNFFASCFLLHSFHVALSSCCTLLVLLFFILYTLVMLQLFSSCNFFALQSCHIVPFFKLQGSNFFVFYFFRAVSCCIFSVLHYLNVPVLSGCTIWMFYFFHIAVFSSWTFAAEHFLRRSFFMPDHFLCCAVSCCTFWQTFYVKSSFFSIYFCK